MEPRDRSLEELTPKEQCERVFEDLQYEFGVFKHTTDQDLFGQGSEARRKRIEAGRFTTKQMDSKGVYNEEEKARVIFGDWTPSNGNLEGSLYTIWDGDDGKKHILRVREQGGSAIYLINEDGQEEFSVMIDNKGKPGYGPSTELIPSRMNGHRIKEITNQGVDTYGSVEPHGRYIGAINRIREGLQKAVITIGHMEQGEQESEISGT